MTWQGSGTFGVNGATTLSSTPGRLVFQYDGEQEWAQIFGSNIDPAHLPTDFHVVRQDQQALYDAGEIFNPAFLDKVSNWDMLRFKDWEETDNSNVTSWSQRPTIENASWSVPGGVPIEVQVRLANESHTDMWVNIPAAADDGYVRDMLTYVRDHLDPSLSVKVEYSNEVWNWGYEQASYSLDKADQLWGKDVNGDGVINRNDPAEHVGDGWTRYYGYRSAQVAAIAHQVFGASDRVDPVLATQTAYEGLEQSILAGVAMAGAGSVSTLFGSYAVTTYFGNELDGGTEADRAQVLNWARSGSAGVDAAFHELEFGGTLEGKGALADIAGYLAYQGGIAAAHGLTMVAYEGGVHLTPASFDPSVRDEVERFFERLNDDPRMGALYAKMVDMFHAAGGTELTAFTDVLRPGPYGDWGALSSIYDDGSPRYDALLAAQNRDVHAPVRTDLASFTLDQTSADLTYTGTGSFTGTGNSFDNVITGGAIGNVLAGGGGNDTLIGGAGHDDLDGGIGADRMVGGAGNDTYHVDQIGDVVVEQAGEGTDTVLVGLATYTLGDNLENLTVTGASSLSFFTGTGNLLDNVITAGSGGSALYGLAGNDTLVGGAGRDLLDGGIGADRMTGGAGDDTYLVDNARDVVVEAAGGGLDEVRTTLGSYTLGANVENLTALGTGTFAGTGNALANLITAGSGAARLYGLDGNDVLVGSGGADLLDGGTGADRMVGGAGDDIYLVDDRGDQVVEASGQGTDTIRTGLDSYTLPGGVERLIYTGTGGFGGYGNELDNVITGGPGSNSLAGGDGNDVLTGGALHDVIDGGTGADRMVGGGGDDDYTVDDAGDVVIEAANGGIDRVLSYVDYQLPANVENLALMGDAPLTGRGNALANAIIGNSGDNLLLGMGGDDFILGQGGSDRLRGGDGNDQLRGNTGSDYLEGEAGNDVLEGGDGNDQVAGGAGRDLVYGGTGADRFVFRQGDFATAPDNSTWIANWADQIGDFSHAEGDRIDVSAVNTGNPNSSAFTFLGAGAFTHHAGELRSVLAGAGFDVMGDTNGDGVADFHFYVASWTVPPTPLVAADFIL